MADVGRRLKGLGMSQYTKPFMTNGFDSWGAVMDITDEDLTFLAVSVVHRERLQKEILRVRPDLKRRRCPSPERKISEEDDMPVKKRRYQRHPVADKHGPKRPLTAYAVYGTQVRHILKDKHLSFTQLAKSTGKGWASLGTKDKNAWKLQAAGRMAIYAREMEIYEQTEDWMQYQIYLRNFHINISKSKRKPLHERMSPPPSDLPENEEIKSNGFFEPWMSQDFVQRIASTESQGISDLQSSLLVTPIRPEAFQIASHQRGLPDPTRGTGPTLGCQLNPPSEHPIRPGYFETVLQ